MPSTAELTTLASMGSPGKAGCGLKAVQRNTAACVGREMRGRSHAHGFGAAALLVIPEDLIGNMVFRYGEKQTRSPIETFGDDERGSRQLPYRPSIIRIV